MVVGSSVVVVAVGFSVVVVVVGFSVIMVVVGVTVGFTVVVVGVTVVVGFSVIIHNNNKLYLYSTFHDVQCSAKCFTEQKLGAVLFRAQVSARSGRLSWPPGGAIIGQCEKAAMCFLTFHGNACMICGTLFQKYILQKSTCWWRYNRPMGKGWHIFLGLVGMCEQNVTEIASCAHDLSILFKMGHSYKL